MQRTVPQSGKFGMAAVTFFQVLPLSGETWTRPSSLPAQSWPGVLYDSATAKIVQYISAPVLSPVIGPPDHCCLFLSLRVRSPLIFAQLWPPLVERKRTLAAW